MYQKINERKKLRPATLLKKRLWHRCFPLKFREICEISKNTFSYRTPLVAASIRTLQSLMGIKHTKVKRSVTFKTAIKKNHNT